MGLRFRVDHYHDLLFNLHGAAVGPRRKQKHNSHPLHHTMDLERNVESRLLLFSSGNNFFGHYYSSHDPGRRFYLFQLAALEMEIVFSSPLFYLAFDSDISERLYRIQELEIVAK